MPTTTTTLDPGDGETPPAPDAVISGSNAHEVTCARCRHRVPARTGVLWRSQSNGWMTTHLTGSCPGAAPTAPAPPKVSKLSGTDRATRDLLKKVMGLLGCDEEAAIDMTMGCDEVEIDAILLMGPSDAAAYLAR